MSIRPLKSLIATVGLVGLLLFTQQTMLAGWKFSPGLNGGPHLFEYQHSVGDYSHLSDTAPATPQPRNVPYTVTLYNPTRVAIAYSLNDQTDPRLKAGEVVRWRIMGSKGNPAVFNISFDNGQNRTISYRLNNKASFEFRYTGKTLDLYKRKP